MRSSSHNAFFLSFFLVFVFSLIHSFALAADAPKNLRKVVIKNPNEPINGVQVLLFEGSTREEIRKELDVIAASGVDTVILRVFHNEGDRPYRFITPSAKSGVYFKTSEAPVVADVLGFILAEAHKRELRVFAWMTTRYADYGIEDKEHIACSAYVKEKKKVGRCKGLDLFSTEAVRHLEALYSDLADYPIDGVLFQDDLILKYNEGFGAHSDRLYRLKTGRPLRPEDMFYFDASSPYATYTPGFGDWASWKNKRLLYVAKRLKDAVRRKRPSVKFAINLMYESVTAPVNALNWFSQDLEAAVKEGFDYYSIMAYHKQMGSELKKSAHEIESMIEELTDAAVSTVKDPSKVLIKLQAVDWESGEEVSGEELTRIIRKVRARKPVSMAVVPYRSTLPFGALSGRVRLGSVDITSTEEVITR